MPIYTYECKKCSVRAEHFQHMSSLPLTNCPTCGGPYNRVPSLPHTDLKEFHKPIEMFSVAVENVEDIRRLKRDCPDADISDDPDHPLYGVPVARTRKAKLQVLKASGYEEINSERVRR